MNFNQNAVIIVLVLAVYGAPAMSSEIPDAKTNKSVHGAVEPDKIPDRVRYGMLIKRYLTDVRDFLIQQLPPEDDAILYAAATNDESWESVEATRYRDIFLEMCANRGNKHAITLERESTKVVSDFNARRVARYREIVSNLSDVGRAVVEEFIETQIVPNSIAAVVDPGRSLAKENPDEFLYELDIECHFMATGEWPQEAQERLDQYRKERSRTRREQEYSEDKK